MPKDYLKVERPLANVFGLNLPDPAVTFGNVMMRHETSFELAPPCAGVFGVGIENAAALKFGAPGADHDSQYAGGQAPLELVPAFRQSPCR